MSIGKQIEHVLRYPLGIVFAYETFAIFTRKVPTISSICWDHNIIFTPIILGGLAAHLIFHEVEEVLIELDILPEVA